MKYAIERERQKGLFKLITAVTVTALLIGGSSAKAQVGPQNAVGGLTKFYDKQSNLIKELHCDFIKTVVIGNDPDGHDILKEDPNQPPRSAECASESGDATERFAFLKQIGAVRATSQLYDANGNLSPVVGTTVWLERTKQWKVSSYDNADTNGYLRVILCDAKGNKWKCRETRNRNRGTGDTAAGKRGKTKRNKKAGR